LKKGSYKTQPAPLHPEHEISDPSGHRATVALCVDFLRCQSSDAMDLGLAIADSIPDATTLWLFREKLPKAGLIEKLFDPFDQHLAANGYMARGGRSFCAGADAAEQS
jgi:hypothetical protein